VWNREFLDTHLTRSWREGELKRHRASLLFDRERSMLPATQSAVEIELQKREISKEYEASAYKLIELKKAVEELEAQRDRQQYFMRNGRWPGAEEEPKGLKRRAFVAACPDADCRGFLSTVYKCGTCQKQFCADCREPKPDDTHTCDPALVETIKAIMKDSRTCPACGMSISRVSGCDQMYCTECDTPFSYSTGERINGVIHNPHYFDRLRKMGLSTNTPAAPAECPQGIPDMRYLRNTTPLYKSSIDRPFYGLYQAAIHVQEVVVSSYPRHIDQQDNTDIRIKYLLKEIDEHKLKLLLQQRDRRRQKELEIRDCLELFLAMCTDFYQACYNRVYKTPEQLKGAFSSLCCHIEDHVNKPLRDIGKRYMNIVPQIIVDTKKERGYFVGQGYKPTATDKVYLPDSTPATISHETA
jgi:hypothetical protein